MGDESSSVYEYTHVPGLGWCPCKICEGLRQSPSMRQFATGATRSSDTGKIDYEGFLSMPALDAFGNYMLKHQVQADGSLRSSSNWKHGMPITGEGSYTKALLRHTIELVGLTTGHVSARLKRELPDASMREMMLDSACAVVFNIQGWLHEFLKDGEFGKA